MGLALILSSGSSLPTSLIYVTDLVLKALGFETPDVGEESRWSLLRGPFPIIRLLSQDFSLGGGRFGVCTRPCRYFHGHHHWPTVAFCRFRPQALNPSQHGPLGSHYQPTQVRRPQNTLDNKSDDLNSVSKQQCDLEKGSSAFSTSTSSSVKWEFREILSLSLFLALKILSPSRKDWEETHQNVSRSYLWGVDSWLFSSFKKWHYSTVNIISWTLS